MVKKVSIVILIVLFANCSKKNDDLTRYEIFSDNKIRITAELNKKATQSKYKGKNEYYGKLHIFNCDTIPHPYSNKFLTLINFCDTFQTYADAITSSVVDFDTILINARDSLVSNVYWVESKSGLKFDCVKDSLHFEYNEMQADF